MRALVLTGKNEPLTIQERPDLQAGINETIVQVHAAALNHRDVWIQKGQYAGLKYPIIPGSDGAGIVAGTGREVIINPSINWGNSPAYQHPKDFRILGLPDDGTFAEYVKAPSENIVDKPAHLSFEEAAALPLAGVTAFRAVVTRGQVQQGEKVLITGIGGGVALFALQYAIALGARVYVSSGSDEKLDKALKLGAIGGVNYRHDDWGRHLQELAGAFDVIIDGAAGDGMDELLNLATPGGRVVFYGATRGNPSGLTARRIFWKQLNILGSTMGNAGDFQSMVAFVSEHGIRPIVDTVFTFSEGEAALRHMDDASQFGKILIKVK
jgi:zinc-binding alcohol dehydrogenase/oxidoreductase